MELMPTLIINLTVLFRYQGTGTMWYWNPLDLDFNFSWYLGTGVISIPVLIPFQGSRMLPVASLYSMQSWQRWKILLWATAFLGG